MRPLVAIGIAMVVLAAAPPAGADTLELAGSPPVRKPTPPAAEKKPLRIQFDAGFGYSAGATQIGSHTYAQIGAKLNAALRIGRVGVTGAYEVGSTNRGSGESLINGQRHRFSLAGGVDVRRWGNSSLFGETHVGAGVGREFIGWEQGSLSRRDVFILVEQRMGFRLYHGGPQRTFIGPEELLFAFGLQLTGSRTPPLALQPIATGPKTGGELDLGFLFSMTLRFRR